MSLGLIVQKGQFHEAFLTTLNKGSVELEEQVTCQMCVRDYL